MKQFLLFKTKLQKDLKDVYFFKSSALRRHSKLCKFFINLISELKKYVIIIIVTNFLTQHIMNHNVNFSIEHFNVCVTIYIK